jgi:hypothetical protein
VVLPLLRVCINCCYLALNWVIWGCLLISVEWLSLRWGYRIHYLIHCWVHSIGDHCSNAYYIYTTCPFHCNTYYLPLQFTFLFSGWNKNSWVRFKSTLYRRSSFEMGLMLLLNLFVSSCIRTGKQFITLEGYIGTCINIAFNLFTRCQTYQSWQTITWNYLDIIIRTNSS